MHYLPNHYLYSKSEIFDWKGNYLSEMKNPLASINSNKKQIPQKNISNILNNDENIDQEIIKPSKKVYNYINKNSKNEIIQKIGKKVSNLKNNSLELKSQTIFSKNKPKCISNLSKIPKKNLLSNENPFHWYTI